MGMFPARIPHYFIQKFTNPGDVVLDPFSGRGTTPLQACAENRIGIGVDLNPLAHLLTGAKVQAPQKDDLLRRIEELETDMFYGLSDEPHEDIQMLFHEHTLRQLVYLKQMLDKDNACDRFILATLTGAMHGAQHRNGQSSSFLSISMPNTFSMSPNYIRKYVEAHGLKKIPIDVFKVLRTRVERLYKKSNPPAQGYAYLGNARELNRVPDPYLRRKQVKLIVSSPPYLRVVKYGLYNWIRLWMLDENVASLDQRLDQHPKLPDYLKFMNEVCKQLYNVMAPGGVCALVIGDVKAPRQTVGLNLALEVWKHLEAKKTKFHLHDILEDTLPKNAKVSKIWGEERGEATLIDRVLVLYKDEFNVLRDVVSWK